MRRLWIWFSSLSRFQQIGICSFAIHATFVLTLSIHQAPKLKKPIAIRTILSLGSQQNETQPSSREKGPILSKPSSVRPLLKSNPAANPIRSNPVQTKPKNQNTGLDLNLLQQIANNLESITSTIKRSERSNVSVSLPSLITTTVPNTPSAQPAYGELVAEVLQKNLELPEFGEVVAQVEINASGSVRSCVILRTESHQNGEFIKKRLQELSFPCFNRSASSESELKFTVTFRNVENHS